MNLNNVKTGYIILSSSTSPLGEAIQTFQKKQDKIYGIYNHAMIACWEYDGLYIYEAEKKGIRKIKFEDEYTKGRYKSILLLKPNLKIDAKKMQDILKIYNEKNTNYDFFHLLIAQPIKILFKKWIGEKKQNTKDFTCAEFCAYTYNKYFDFELFQNSTQIKPLDLALSSFFTHEILK